MVEVLIAGILLASALAAVSRISVAALSGSANLSDRARIEAAINDNITEANSELNSYLENYYLRPAEEIRREQYSVAGDRASVTDWLNDFVEGGAEHLCIRFTGSNDEKQMEELALLREQW